MHLRNPRGKQGIIAANEVRYSTGFFITAIVQIMIWLSLFFLSWELVEKISEKQKKSKSNLLILILVGFSVLLLNLRLCLNQFRNRIY